MRRAGGDQGQECGRKTILMLESVPDRLADLPVAVAGPAAVDHEYLAIAGVCALKLVQETRAAHALELVPLDQTDGTAGAT